MRYRLLGTTGLRVSEIALGTMTFSKASLPRVAQPSPGAQWSWCSTESDARSIFARFIDAGGNFIDTANVYAGGTAEPLVGELIAGERDRVVLATKYGLSTDDSDVSSGGSGAKAIVQAVEASLRRLGTDRIDLLWLHAWDGITPLDEVARALDLVTRMGKVLHVGASDTPAWACALLHSYAALRAYTPIGALQLRCSVLDRSAEVELLPFARYAGVGVAAFGVFGGGALSGGRRRVELNERERRVAAALAPVADAHGAEAAQVALAWLRQRHPDITPIVGARLPHHLDRVLAALDLTLDGEQLAALDAAAPPPALFPHDVLDAIGRQLRSKLAP